MPPDIAVPVAPPLVNLYDVELVHAGQWDISTGTWVATTEDLTYAVAALGCPAVRSPVIKIGHTDPRFDGEPAVGWIGSMRVVDGYTLTGNYMGLPGWLASTDAAGNSVLSSAWPDRSVEGRYDFRCQLGHLHPFVIEAVALLGVTPPGIGTLASLQDIAALYGVVASAHEPSGVPVSTVIHASKETAVPNPRPLTVAAGVTTEDVRRKYYDDAVWSHWITEVQLDPLQLIVVDDNSGKYFRVAVSIDGEDAFSFGDPVEVVVRYIDVPADGNVSASRLVYASRAEARPGDKPTAPHEPAAVVPNETSEPAAARVAASSPAAEPDPSTKSEEDDVPDLSEIARRLGLPDDAPQEKILAALDERQPTNPTTDPVAPRQPAATEPATPVAIEPTPASVATPQPDLVAAAAATSAKRDQEFAAAVGEIKTLSQELAQIKAEKAATVKTAFFAAAVQAGKIRPADRASWESRYDKSPELVTEIIGAMAAGSAVPVSVAGYVGDPEPDADADFEAAIARIDGPYAKKEATN